MKKFAAMIFIMGIIMVLFVVSVSEASLNSEIKWIDGISGLKFITGVDKDTVATRRYFVSNDDSTVMSSIKSGLKKRGWKMGKGSTVEAAGSKVITLKGTKGSMRIEVVLRKTVAEGGLDVVIRGRSASSDAGETTEITEDVSTSGVSIAGASESIMDSHVEKTYRCKNTAFDILGSHNEITLLGTCKSLTINGAHNKVVIKAKISSISIMGSYNTVYWSKKLNPTKPDVSNLGNRNEVKVIP